MFFKRSLVGLWCAAIIMVGWGVFAFPVSAANVSQGYQSADVLVVGNLVSTTGSGSNQIQLATTAQADNLLGIVVAANSTLLTVDATGTSVQVATGGLANAYVDDLGGAIQKGDPITVSPLNGVGMKATVPTRVVGIAQSDFSSLTNRQTKQITDKQGQSKTTQVGLLPILVSVGSYQPSSYSGVSSVVRGVQSAASNLAGHSISAVRAMAAFGVVVLAIILAIVILYASVTGSIRSIGRNPLAKKSVLRSLAQVIIAVSIIVLAALVAVYVIVVA